MNIKNNNRYSHANILFAYVEALMLYRCPMCARIFLFTSFAEMNIKEKQWDLYK